MLLISYEEGNFPSMTALKNIRHHVHSMHVASAKWQWQQHASPRLNGSR